MTNSVATILLGGEVTVTPRLLGQVRGSRVFAADGGMRHAAVLGVEAESWIGDFDSSHADLLQNNQTVPRESHPVAKDQTDGALAVERAIEQGAKELILVGAFGGRSDHAMAHLLMALALHQRGYAVVLTNGAEEAVVVEKKPKKQDWPMGATFSLLAFSDLEDVCISGGEWPLDNARIPQGGTLGLSNKVQGSLALSVGNGQCIAIATLQNKVDG